MKIARISAGILLLTTTLLSIGSNASAQSFNDIILYSQQQFTGTARNTAIGGAMNAVGADLSNMATNPAGIGMLHSTQFALSGGLGLFHGKETYLNQSTSLIRPFGSLDGLGVVLHIPLNPESTSGLLGFNLGFGYNKSADYSYAYTAEGNTNQYRLMDALALQAEDILYPQVLDINQAFKRFNWYLVLADLGGGIMPENTAHEIYDPDKHTGRESEFPFRPRWDYGEDVHQQCEMTSTGRNSELDFTASFNYSNRLFLGATIGVPLIYRSYTRIFTESTNQAAAKNADYFKSHPNNDLSSIQFTEKSTDDGTGINLKLGLLGKITESLRIGLAFHTPSYIRIATRSTVDVNSEFLKADSKGNISAQEKSPEAQDTYSAFGPMRGLASLSYLFGRYGLIAASYQATALPLAQFTNHSQYREDNRILQEHTKVMHQLNLGAEILLGPLALRLGGGFETDPYPKDQWNPHGQRVWYSGGFGYSGSSFYLDLAYRHMVTQGESPLYAYTSQTYGSIVAPAKRKGQQGLLMATLGFRL